jgi:hypothetical protein
VTAGTRLRLYLPQVVCQTLPDIEQRYDAYRANFTLLLGGLVQCMGEAVCISWLPTCPVTIHVLQTRLFCRCVPRAERPGSASSAAAMGLSVQPCSALNANLPRGLTGGS